MIEKDKYINSNYEIMRYLEGGAYGQVILAKNKDNYSKAAIKYIDFKNFEDESNIDKVIQEGQILFKLSHENIIKFEDFTYNKSRAILIMEYAEGGDLNNKIKEQQEKKEPFKEDQIITWFLELCTVIKYCHLQAILHRDLKPQNIFLNKDDHIKLGDFGVSKVLKSIEERT